MTISTLLEQFKKEFGYSEYEDIDRGSFRDCSCECELNGKAIIDWLRTHITEMVKEAIELNKGISSQGYCTKRNENKTLDANLCVDIEQAVTHGLLQTLGIEK